MAGELLRHQPDKVVVVIVIVIVVAAVRNVQVLLYCIIYRYCVPCVCNALQNDEVVLSYFWQSYARACATSAHVYLAC